MPAGSCCGLIILLGFVAEVGPMMQAGRLENVIKVFIIKQILTKREKKLTGTDNTGKPGHKPNNDQTLKWWKQAG